MNGSGIMKFVVIKKRAVALGVCLIFAAVMLMMCLSFTGAYGVYYGLPLRKIPVYRVATDQKKIALSFDAAYGSDRTEGIMEILKEYKADATFFLVGFWIENNPEKTKKIMENGFEIGTHSNTHSHMSKFTYSQCEEDLRQSVNIIEKYTQCKPTLFRAPFGEYNNTLIEAAEALGLKTIQWDVDSLDWMQKTTLQIITRVTGRAKEGSIILFHNNAEHILDVLPVVLDRLSKKGFEFVRISDLIYQDNYLIDSKGEQHKKT
jgi:polysaccharide deacetylase family sporulation protein PdaB